MAHYVRAMVTRQTVDRQAARNLRLKLIRESEFTIVGLGSLSDSKWSDGLGLEPQGDSVLRLDNRIAVEFAREIGLDHFAIIRTEYFGGVGEQYGSVFERGVQVMPITLGGINQALSLIGVTCREGQDEFDTIGLGHHRDL